MNMNFENQLEEMFGQVFQHVFENITSGLSSNAAGDKIDSLSSRFSAMEDASTKYRKTMENVQKELQNVTKTFEKGLAQIMSKIDLLVSKQCHVSANSTATIVPTITSSPSTPIFSSSAEPTSLMMLTQAAEQGNMEALLKILGSGVTVHQRDEKNDSALHLAAARGHLHAVTALLGAGAAVNAAGNLMRTPLHCAAIGGHEGIVFRLLAAGASINDEDMAGDTALGAAANAGKWNMVKLLLQNGASSKGGENATTSPLQRASEAGESEIVRVLLKRTIYWPSGELWCALSFAKNVSVVRTFDDIFVGCIQGKLGNNAMFHAAGKGRLESMIVLLDAGVNIQAKNANGNALGYACFAGRVECVKALLQRGIKTNIKDKNGFTPLHNAARKGHETCVRLLLNAGADKKTRNIAGQTPLDLAGSKAIRKMLLSNIRSFD